MNKDNPSGAGLLALEETQLRYFLTAVRPVGEEKSELYPEPQYFNTTFIAIAAQLPGTIRRIAERAGGAAGYAKRLQQVLAPATALHLSGLAFLATWGREMWLLDEPEADRRRGLIADGAPLLPDTATADTLRFSFDATSHYRQDGAAYPHPGAALGDNYRILPQDEAVALAGEAEAVDRAGAQEVLGLLAAVRALSFLMEAETREALMMHGPYPLASGDPLASGEALIVFECCDLQWQVFPEFPLPGGVRWTLPGRPFPTANLAIALVVKGCQVQADRFGTLYVDPLTPEQVVGAALFSRDEKSGLAPIPVAEARSLRRLCDDIQEQLFFQIAEWTLEQRMAAGIYQEHMLLLRMLAGAGWKTDEMSAELAAFLRTSQPIIDRYFHKNLGRSADQLPFYSRLTAFAGGARDHLFTPLLNND